MSSIRRPSIALDSENARVEREMDDMRQEISAMEAHQRRVAMAQSGGRGQVRARFDEIMEQKAKNRDVLLSGLYVPSGQPSHALPVGHRLY